MSSEPSNQASEGQGREKTHVPDATYRLQFGPGFSFQDAEAIVEYLRDLGISHIYSSPVFASLTGSEHGYDITDPNRINPRLGGRKGLDSLLRRCHETGLGWIQDMVPNHMAYSCQNPWLADVLEKGPASIYAGYFAINWNHPHPSLYRRIAAPFLGNPYADCLESGDLGISFQEGRFLLSYFQMRLPLCPESYPRMLELGLRELESRGSEHSGEAALLREALSLCNAADQPEAKQRLTKILLDLEARGDGFSHWLQGFLREANSAPRSREWTAFLDRLVREQHYLPAHWEMACEESGYRRFFAINDLICLRQEREEVYEDTHRLLLELWELGRIHGLRVDHLDGLADPAEYLERLRSDLPGAYLLAEKILAPGEELPPWPIQGTTGYDCLFMFNSVLCDPRGEQGLDRIQSEMDPEADSGGQSIPEQKRHVLELEMGGDLDLLVRLLAPGISAIPCGRDLGFYRLRRAVASLASAFPVYRSYVRPGQEMRQEDAKLLQSALQRAASRDPGSHAALRCLAEFLTLPGRDLDQEAAQARDAFLERLQQTTTALAAKGFEDTHLYTYNRLTSLNEVGGDPHRLGIDPEEFHEFMLHRAECWPHSMSATATHDTKRGEDVRARLNVLSEMPRTWEQEVLAWRQINRESAAKLPGGRAPDGNEEYLIYQTLVGTFPCNGLDIKKYRERMGQYLLKALREAKRNTSWHRPNEEHERACLDFLNSLLPDSKKGLFLERFRVFQQRIAHLGIINSLAQVVLKATCPGVPDIYQGTELMDLSLVDPDNRRQVDYDLRRTSLDRILSGWQEDPESLLRELLRDPHSGKAKMHALSACLLARREQKALFGEGQYLPLRAEGKLAEHVLAFCRRRGGDLALTVVPRLPSYLVDAPQWPLGREVWGDTRLIPPEGAGPWLDRISAASHPAGETLYVGDLLARFPVSLLVGV